ncbi:unnamed protein product [Symbiodinium pilosum]|uniref:Uncharacterized protein n=1 Tax=Symbiodinium pilosum TaxID=2952 RepID=A0A812Q5D2_SYMPI|nr:unnamed protein product [Symbiodinium pilosum]
MFFQAALDQRKITRTHRILESPGVKCAEDRYWKLRQCPCLLSVLLQKQGRDDSNYTGSLEGQNELLQFLKAIRPEWSFPKKNGKSNVRSVMDKLKAVGVTSVWGLFRAVMRNTINEDLAQAGYSVLSKETLDRIRKRMSFFRQLDVLTETDCRQTGAFAPVPQLLSQKKLAYWSKVAPQVHDGNKTDDRSSSPEGRARSSQRRSRAVTDNTNSIGPTSIPLSSFTGSLSAPTLDSTHESSQIWAVEDLEMERPKLRGVRKPLHAGRSAAKSREGLEMFRPSDSEAEMQEPERWALKSSLRPAAKTWQAGDPRGDPRFPTSSDIEKPPKIGLLRQASQMSCPGEDQSTASLLMQAPPDMSRLRLGSGQSSSVMIVTTPVNRTNSVSMDRSSSCQHSQDADTLLSAVERLHQEAAAMQDFRPPSWSVLRRHPESLIENGQAMLDEQEALHERSKLYKLMQQEGLYSPMRRHVAENVKSRLKEESDKVAAEGLEMQHKCTNIRKHLGQMMNARRDLASLRRAIVGRNIDPDEQLKSGLLLMG